MVLWCITSFSKNAVFAQIGAVTRQRVRLFYFTIPWNFY